jgi:hypothetical protein
MPPSRTKDKSQAQLCRITDAASGREVIQHVLPFNVVDTFDESGIQRKYHQNILKYVSFTSITIPGTLLHQITIVFFEPNRIKVDTPL